ncbi:hypothetical protein ACIQXD_35485 [Streptomyces uncialis]|uniref:hypothetical protein n=1 Tax=Streptomyces uncialis TaxID=1048205 RepID=UPI0037FD886A
MADSVKAAACPLALIDPLSPPVRWRLAMAGTFGAFAHRPAPTAAVAGLPAT